MAEDIDQEIEAIKATLLALEPLPPAVRSSVLEYVLRRLKITLSPAHQAGVTGAPAIDTHATPSPSKGTAPEEKETAPAHIKDLKEKKKPRSANEMAALVAYYLENVAPTGKRKDRISTKDVETYFKIANFRLPEKPQFTLANAKAAGYFDAIGNGEYKLNAVGYNLVAHSMPRGRRNESVSKRKAIKKVKPRAEKKKTERRTKKK